MYTTHTYKTAPSVMSETGTAANVFSIYASCVDNFTIHFIPSVVCALMEMKVFTEPAFSLLVFPIVCCARGKWQTNLCFVMPEQQQRRQYVGNSYHSIERALKLTCDFTVAEAMGLNRISVRVFPWLLRAIHLFGGISFFHMKIPLNFATLSTVDRCQ